MEFNQSSDFIIKDKPADAEMLEQYGATSIAYKMCINGKMYFMKRLRPELCRDSRYRDLFYKEFNTGKNIKSPYNEIMKEIQATNKDVVIDEFNNF